VKGKSNTASCAPALNGEACWVISANLKHRHAIFVVPHAQQSSSLRTIPSCGIMMISSVQSSGSLSICSSSQGTRTLFFACPSWLSSPDNTKILPLEDEAWHHGRPKVLAKIPHPLRSTEQFPTPWDDC